MSGVYGGVSAQDRRAERRARLLEAGLDLLGTEGWKATSVRGVCARAKLTPRFFYESFEDLDELAVAVFDHVAGATGLLVFDALAAAEDAPAPERLRIAVDAFVRHITDDPRRARVVFVETHATEALSARRVAAMRELAQTIAGQARVAYGIPPGAAAEVDPLVDFTATLLAGGLAELLVTWLRGELPVSRDQLIDDYVALFVATGDAAARISRERARRDATSSS